MEYEYKAKRSVILLAPDLTTPVALNVVAHLATSLSAVVGSQMIGRPQLLDGSGGVHLGVAKYAIIVKVARPTKIRTAIQEARGKPEILIADYPREVLASGHDDELAEAIARIAEPDIEYLGALFFGPTPSVDAVCHKFSLWKDSK